ncbi:response regulator [Alkalimonas collagenimarina]|uniref:Response regulator n=1 Tax=Alkalimonas collagenimarina TaxID=400390 RepID=A0ABT9GUY0_9GAMM|nr:response regulator [Alkalimonas collagenimarina]MDP4534862.1 response regulator [Alkalimonas collagenimarina]
MNHISIADLSMLLVEPSDMQRKVIMKHLQQEGIQHIDQAATLAEAKQRLHNHQPDLIASALHFSDGTASDLLDFIHQQPTLAHLPFMLVSSEHRKSQLEQFKQSGVIAILPKPFTADHLGMALNAAVDLLTPSELELSMFDVHDVRVLVVDDSTLARNHIQRVLRNMGIQHLVEAKDGKEAIAILQQQMFDLVVTDYNMPEINGRELTSYIREHSQQAHIPILMVTSEANDAHLSTIEQAGVNAVCDKPFAPETVKSLLFKLLE